MTAFYDEDGNEVALKDMVRLWSYWPDRGRIKTTLCLKHRQQSVIEEIRAGGAHVWTTRPFVVTL